MTLEQALLIAISTLVTALSWAVKQLYMDSKQCKADRATMNLRLNVLEHEHGIAQGRLSQFDNCPANDCPLRPDRPKRTTSRVMLRPNAPTA